MTKKLKIILIVIGIFSIIVISSAFAYIMWEGKSIPVIMYHGVSDTYLGKDKEMFVKTKDFERQMRYLKKHHYKTLFVEDMFKNHNGEKNIVLTFDDGYEDFYLNVLPILKKYKLKANLYVVTSFIDTPNYLTKTELQSIVDSHLVSIGSHTNSHSVLTNLSLDKVEEELKVSKSILEDITKREVKTISYPTGAYNDDIINISKKYYTYGITTDAHIEFTKDLDKYAIKRRGIGRSSKMYDFKKILFRSSIFRREYK